MKNIKITTIILAIILITLVAFFGVYLKTQNRMENKVKDYLLGRELEGGREVELEVANESNSGEEGEEKKQDTSKLTPENYEIVKKTIEKRLDNLRAEDYTISLNKETGAIRVELAENDNTDSFAYYLTASNEISLKEKDTETELLNDAMIKKSKYSYISDMEGKYQASIELQLTDEGQEKIKEAAEKYALLSTEIAEIETAKKAKEEAEKEAEEKAEGEETENTENKEENENKEETDKKENEEEGKKIAVLTIAGTEYGISKIENNKIVVNIGGATASSASANNNIAKAAELEMLINAGKYPVKYELANNRYVYSDITKTQILYIALGIIAITLVALVIISIKYRGLGILSSISCIGLISLLLLLLRYANVLITIEGIGAIVVIIAINLKVIQTLLRKIEQEDIINKAVNETYKEIFLKLIPIMIISITFCFSGLASLISFGMVMFWGMILVAIYNILVTKTLLKLKESK